VADQLWFMTRIRQEECEYGVTSLRFSSVFGYTFETVQAIQT